MRRSEEVGGCIVLGGGCRRWVENRGALHFLRAVLPPPTQPWGSLFCLSWCLVFPTYLFLCSCSNQVFRGFSSLLSAKVRGEGASRAENASCWLDPLAVQEILKGLLQSHSSKASILWCSVFFMVQLSHPYLCHPYLFLYLYHPYLYLYLSIHLTSKAMEKP